MRVNVSCVKTETDFFMTLELDVQFNLRGPVSSFALLILSYNVCRHDIYANWTVL